MDHRRCFIERGFRVGDGGQRLVVDLRSARRRPRLRARLRATTAHTASPCQQARSMAMAYCGADLRPLRCVSTPTHGVMTFASSAPVTTATTPGAFFAAAVSMFLMRACACGERRKATCAMRGNVDVADILPAPLHQSRQVRPRHRAADIGIRPVERGGLIGESFMAHPPPRRGRGTMRSMVEGAGLLRWPSRPFRLASLATSPHAGRSEPRLRHRFDRIDDRLIAGAAAVIAGEMLADCLAARHVAAREQFLRADQHAGRAIAALQRVALAGRRAADRRSRRCPTGPRWFRPPRRRIAPPASGSRARSRRRAHRAGAADAVLAADMGAGQRKILAQEIDQRLARFDVGGNGFRR